VERAVSFVAFAVAAVSAMSAACSPAAATRTAGAERTESPVASAPAHPPRGDGAHPALQARVPGTGGSQTAIAPGLRGDTVTETESCAGCHADAAAQWSASVHAFGSFNNPVYRASVDRYRRTVGRDASRFCGGCHDVALFADGAMGGDVDADDPRARGGISCRVCHGIEAARPDGNGSYDLASSPIPIPRDGDAASLSAHRARMALAPLRTAAMCGACHRSFLSPETGNPAHLVGQDELGAWRRSVYAGSLAARVDEPVAPAECRTCHMPLEDAPLGDAATKNGQIRSHRFAGAHTWLAAMRGDAAQLAAERAMLRGAASIDVAAARSGDGRWTLPADGAEVTPGTPMTLDVVVRNEHAGHRFPGGVVDAQDTWIELRVTDAAGRLIADAGAGHVTSDDDATAHLLRAVQGDDDGRALLDRETDRFRTPVFNHTLAPRDAEVVRYRFDVPPRTATADLPLRVVATLRHRTRNASVQRATCEESKTARGRAFAHFAADPGRAPLDACAAQPITDIAEAVTWLGGPAPDDAPPPLPRWRRLYDHALGLSHALQEDVDDARGSLEAALGALPAGAARERAEVLALGAEIATREGRTGEAIERLGDAERMLPGHPAIARATADALAGIWRWNDAMQPMNRAALGAPLDDTLWARLAVACGSADDPEAALAATARGLELSPRDADLLRVQALALERLGAPAEEADRARAAFAAWRAPDTAPAVKNACAQRYGWCALERLPVHVHRMRPGPAFTLPRR
jgi:tetratricopeptide (TPR) repeat protein